jgi:hypothetical protein
LRIVSSLRLLHDENVLHFQSHPNRSPSCQEDYMH